MPKAWAMKSEGQGHVDVGAVQVERVAGRTPGRRPSATGRSASSFSIKGISADSEELVARTNRSSLLMYAAGGGC